MFQQQNERKGKWSPHLAQKKVEHDNFQNTSKKNKGKEGYLVGVG